MLGLKPGATAEAVKLAYFDASRVFHPDRYYGKNLGSFRARLERIFQRLSEAHETLTEALRRAPPREAGPLCRRGLRPRGVVPASPSGSTAAVDPRAEERRARLARHPYLASKARAGALVDEAQRQLRAAPDKALQLLEQAKVLGGASAKERAPTLETEAKQQLASKRAEDEMRSGTPPPRRGTTRSAAHAYVPCVEPRPLPGGRGVRGGPVGPQDGWDAGRGPGVRPARGVAPRRTTWSPS